MTTTHRAYTIVRTTQSDFELMAILLERISHEILFTNIISITPEYHNIGLTIEVAYEGEPVTNTETVIAPDTTPTFRNRIQVEYEWNAAYGTFTAKLFKDGALQLTETDSYSNIVNTIILWQHDHQLPVETYGKWIADSLYRKAAIQATWF